MKKIQNISGKNVIEGVMITVISAFLIWMGQLFPKISVVCEEFPRYKENQIRMEQKLNSIALYLARNPNCELSFFQKKEITEDNCWDILNGECLKE